MYELTEFICFLMSRERYLMGTFTKSGFSISAFKKINCAPYFASDITLLKRSFVSRKSVAGDPKLCAYDNRSPPITKRILHSLSFNDLWSQTKLAYPTFISCDISERDKIDCIGGLNPCIISLC